MAEAELDRGATFRFTLGAADAEVAAAPKVKPGAETSEDNNKARQREPGHEYARSGHSFSGRQS